jgi:hypothetical protein
MIASTRKHSPEDKKTVEFRQRACLLASRATKASRNGNEESSSVEHLDTLPSLRVAQHLLARHHPGHVPVEYIKEMNGSLLKRTNDGPSSVAEDKGATEDAVGTYLACPTCGGALQPGFGGMNIRLLRNVKRRKQSKPKDEQLASIEIPNGHSYLQLFCGSCGCRSHVPGLPPHKKTKQAAEVRAVSKKAAPAKGPKAGDEEKESREEEFVALPSIAPPPRREPKRKLNPLQGKKKKRGKLLDFLSSLND